MQDAKTQRNQLNLSFQKVGLENTTDTLIATTGPPLRLIQFKHTYARHVPFVDNLSVLIYYQISLSFHRIENCVLSNSHCD